MTWVFALVVVAVLGATAVVAAGRGGSMSEVYDDRPDALVPADRPLTAADVRRVRFGTALRGYRMAEVDALLERLAAELEGAQQADPELVHRRDHGSPPRADGVPPPGAPADPPAAP